MTSFLPWYNSCPPPSTTGRSTSPVWSTHSPGRSYFASEPAGWMNKCVKQSSYLTPAGVEVHLLWGMYTHQFQSRTKSTVQWETFKRENFHKSEILWQAQASNLWKFSPGKIVFFTNSWKFPTIWYERPWQTGVKLQRIYSYQTTVSIPLLAMSYHSLNHSISAHIYVPQLPR